jgi:DNA-binding transcriptional regulator YiaG
MTFNPIYISDRLRQLWKASGLGKPDFARKLNTSPATLSRWMDGTNCPSLYKLCDIANRTKTRVDWFLTE